MNDSPRSFPINSRGSESSPLVKVEVTSSRYPFHLDVNQLAKEVIHISKDSNSYNISKGSSDKEASSSDPYFHSLFYDEDAGNDRAVDSMLASSKVAEASTSLIF